MNDTNASETSSITAAETWVQAIVFYFLGAGILGALVNALIVLAIRRNKELRSRLFIIIIFLSLCRLLLCLNLGVTGIQRALRQVGIISLEQKRVVCSAMHIWLLNGLTLELMLILLLVIDRVIAITLPVRYSRVSDKQALYVCVILYVISILIKVLPGIFWDAEPLEVIPCHNGYSGTSENSSNFGRYLDVTLGAVIIFLYVALMVHIRFGINRQLPREASEVAKQSLQRQLALMPMLRNQVLLHSGLSLLSKLLFMAGGVFPAQDARFVFWGGNFLVIDLLVNTMAVIIGNRDIRESMTGLLRL